MVLNINGNWIKLFSKFVNWEWYTDQNTKSLFLHCLLKANWKESKFMGETIPRGSFVTSLDSLGKELGLTVQEIRTALKHLISTNELTSKSTNKYRIITVVNYELYQQVNNQNNSQLTINQQATNNQSKENILFLTNILTNLKSKENADFKGKNDVIDFLTNILSNNQLTIKNENYTENQQQYKTLEYKTNSVCNNAYACEEDFICHLGCMYKTLDCKNCMKKWKCPLPDEPTFKGLHGKTFYEYVAEIELRKLEVARELEAMEAMRGSPNPELDDYDWLNDKGDE